MPNASGITSLPLQSLGLPVRVSNWLADAGLPTVPLDTTAVRRGIAPRRGAKSIVLFDSRNASARTDAEAAEDLGYESIDAAQLLSARTADESDHANGGRTDLRRRFFEGLRGAVEGAGGLWVRVADLPYPYHWCVCDDADEPTVADALDGPEPEIATADSAETLRISAAAGRPVRIAGEAGRTLPAGPRRPITWNTNSREFRAWWSFRKRLRFTVVRRGRSLEIERTSDDARARGELTPALEIWRGKHFALLPVSGAASVRDESLAFQMNLRRNPAGFTACGREIDFGLSNERTLLVASA